MRALLAAAMVLVPSVALAVPPQGVEFKPRRGFFTETNIGAFFTVGGNDYYSNAQTYLQLGVGYDISDVFEVGVSFGLGANAANCFAGRNGRDCNEPDNFTVSLLNGSLAYNIKLRDRLYVAPKITAGFAMLDPAPVRANGTPINRALNAGIGFGAEYVTAMDHFSIGLDVMGRYLFAANIPTIAVFPRVKYTF